MNIWTKIKSLFTSETISPPRTHIVIFDGENVNPTAFGKVYKQNLPIQWKWVSGTSIPKAVSKRRVPIEVPLKHGKESADTHIAMDIMNMCHTDNTITMITLVTNDTDFFDVIGYAGKKFPNIKFVLAVDALRPYKKTSTKLLPPNSSVVYFK